jgi:hypothetical protein
MRKVIQTLKTDEDLLEPVEREVAARLELDSDRQGVPGSPDLAATIFEKIEAADVFLADVTPSKSIELPPCASDRISRSADGQ